MLDDLIRLVLGGWTARLARRVDADLRWLRSFYYTHRATAVPARKKNEDYYGCDRVQRLLRLKAYLSTRNLRG